jgi:hypothetical protein
MKNLKRNTAIQLVIVESVLLMVLTISVILFLWTASSPSQYLHTEELKVQSIIFSHFGSIDLVVRNVGTADFTIDEVWINGAKQNFTSNSSGTVFSPNRFLCLSVPFLYLKGFSYQIRIVSSKGNVFEQSATAGVTCL